MLKRSQDLVDGFVPDERVEIITLHSQIPPDLPSLDRVLPADSAMSGPMPNSSSGHGFTRWKPFAVAKRAIFRANSKTRAPSLGLEGTLNSPFGSRAALSLVAERPDQASVIHC